jgi:hypothetical protein
MDSSVGSRLSLGCSLGVEAQEYLDHYSMSTAESLFILTHNLTQFTNLPSTFCEVDLTCDAVKEEFWQFWCILQSYINLVYMYTRSEQHGPGN